MRYSKISYVNSEIYIFFESNVMFIFLVKYTLKSFIGMIHATLSFSIKEHPASP